MLSLFATIFTEYSTTLTLLRNPQTRKKRASNQKLKTDFNKNARNQKNKGKNKKQTGKQINQNVILNENTRKLNNEQNLHNCCTKGRWYWSRSY